jgi:hypothetical protein
MQLATAVTEREIDVLKNFVSPVQHRALTEFEDVVGVGTEILSGDGETQSWWEDRHTNTGEY